VKPRFDEQATAIKERVLDSPVVCSDETSARVEITLALTNDYRAYFLCQTRCL